MKHCPSSQKQTADLLFMLRRFLSEDDLEKTNKQTNKQQQQKQTNKRTTTTTKTPK